MGLTVITSYLQLKSLGFELYYFGLRVLFKKIFLLLLFLLVSVSNLYTITSCVIYNMWLIVSLIKQNLTMNHGILTQFICVTNLQLNTFKSCSMETFGLVTKDLRPQV